jgi:hypothetical protein
MSIPELTVARMLELAHGQAQNIIVGNKEQIMPVFMILTGDDKIVFVGTPWDGDDQKDMAVVMLRELMREHKAVAYSFLTEAWVAPQPKGWKISDPRGPAPVDRPDRKEVVLAMATNGTNTQYKSWDIVRDAKGNCIGLVEEKKITTFALGRFEGLLPTSIH